jgi:hypothetical protein
MLYELVASLPTEVEVAQWQPFYLLAEETVQNSQQQDCRLILEISAPDGADHQALHKAAEIAIKEQFAQGLTLKPITKRAASQYLQVDPAQDHGSLNLTCDNIPVIWHLARII